MTGAANVLEIGVFEGETSIKMIEALPYGGKYTGIDINDYLNHDLNSFGAEVEFILGESIEVMQWMDPEQFDLIFVDGNDRVQCLNDSIGRAPIIVCHDTHQAVQNWKDAIIPDTYKQLTYIGCLPYYTTIFHHIDLDLESRILDVRNYTHKNTFIDSNFWTNEDIINMYKQQSI